MALHDLILAIVPVNIVLILPLSIVTFLVIRILYLISSFHPLGHVPGPILPRTTSLWLVYHAWIGDECTRIHSLHEKFGPIVRTGPDSVHISLGTALHDIYSGSSATKTTSTGFLKPDIYSNFDVDGHISIFSALDPGHRSIRAKAVTGIFSMSSLRKGQDIIDACVKRFIERMKREKERAMLREGETRGRIDVLNISRGLAIDSVTSYLFGKVYGGCEEDLQVINDKEYALSAIPANKTQKSISNKLSASAMVNAFVAVGRFWYLPPTAFALLDRLINTFNPDHEANRSIAQIDDFLTVLVAKAEHDASSLKGSSPGLDETYQTRLLNASISASETHAQCKDLIFAGTDSTAMNLATIIHGLCGSPSWLQKLTEEIENSDPNEDPQNLPCLRVTVREGLRLAMANPSRLARVVPPSGWTFEGRFLPPGTVVGVSTFELHFNPDVFPRPRDFRPERWLEAGGVRLECMNRDFIPFGTGPRQCIARNLATVELLWAVRELVKCRLLEGGRPVRDKIEILEWFNSKVMGEKIEVEWR